MSDRTSFNGLGRMSLRTPRSWLFAPGDSPAKMAKAAASGAGALILDLEDAVAAPNKAAARDAVAEFLWASPAAGPQLWVRINPLSTDLALADLAAVVPARPRGVVLPKPDSAADALSLALELDRLEDAADLEPGAIRILPIATETPASLFNLNGYRTVGTRLAGLTWGAEDLAAGVGAQANRTPDGGLTDLCRLARSLCLAGAANAGVPAVETVYAGFRDLDGLRAYAEAGRRDGFVGMMAIHPAQVGVIEAVFTPSQAEIDRARQVVALFAEQPAAGALSLEGRMLDRPHLLQAERLLASL
jgi:citrate lyase subunit beta/citryl-CoA lyase